MEVDATPTAAARSFSRKHPFLAELTRHDRLTRPGSMKDTRHFVLNLAGSGLTYTPGDSLGAFGHNPPELVYETIRLLGFDPETPVADCLAGETRPLDQALLRSYTLNRANRKVMAALVVRLPQGEERNRLMQLVEDPTALAAYVESRDYIDILKEFPQARFETAPDFVAQLTPIAPRLYSIASSPLLHPEEAHLCIEVVRFTNHGRARKGLASGFFADHTERFVKNIPVYVQESRSFRLPEDTSADVVMCGPGTGVAPFRAFIQHRAAMGAAGRNWLFFGEQHRATDFLYEHEFLGWHRDGRLHRLDLAFSRDQADKVYVQHRMREQARELWKWLESGAYFYVCGDARHMARDVHQTLIEIARTEGGLSPEAAEHYVTVRMMREEKRYLRDVY